MTERKGKGFASMTPERRREIARKGGKSVPPEKRSFSANPDLASKAGQKGGVSTAPENRTFSVNRALAVEAGRKGGSATHNGGPMRQPEDAHKADKAVKLKNKRTKIEKK